MPKTYFIANWKMFKTISESVDYLTQLENQLKNLDPNKKVIVAPPFTSLDASSKIISSESKISLGAQNCHHELEGAFTGEISIHFLKDLGLNYCIVGHSERRNIFKETDHDINLKNKALLKHQLTPIFCVGESIETREEGKTLDFIKNQLEIGLKDIEPKDWSKIIFAYEPIWAIGTGIAATSEQANEVHQTIRQFLAKELGESNALEIPIVYGGSVKPSNIEELLAKEHINGALIGSASLTTESMIKMINL